MLFDNGPFLLNISWAPDGVKWRRGYDYFIYEASLALPDSEVTSRGMLTTIDNATMIAEI